MEQLTVQLDERVQHFLQGKKKMFISGQFVESASGKTFDTPNPATGETLATVYEGDKQDIGLAVQAARKAFDEGP